MKIVDRETFIRMPAGTIYAPYKPCIFDRGFYIKTDTGWEYFNQWTNKKGWMFNGAMPLNPQFLDQVFPDSPCTYETEMLIYDEDANDTSNIALFAVLEPHEAQRLICALQWAMGGCPEGGCEKING